MALEKEFGIKIKSQEIGREVFSSVASLSQFIDGRDLSSVPARRRPSAEAAPPMLETGRSRRVVVSGVGRGERLRLGGRARSGQGLRAGATAIRPLPSLRHRRPPHPPRGRGRRAAARRRRRVPAALAATAVAARRPLRRSPPPPRRWPGPGSRRRCATCRRAAGVFFGSSTGGMCESERFFAELIARPAARRRPPPWPRSR